jgi:hypothetical protein
VDPENEISAGTENCTTSYECLDTEIKL